MKKIVCIVLLLGMLLIMCSCSETDVEEQKKIEKIQIIDENYSNSLQFEVNGWLYHNSHVEVIEIEIFVHGSYPYHHIAMIHYME